MKVNELRIGSVVGDFIGTAGVVDSIELYPLSFEYYISFKDSSYCDLEDLQPIPLTEQWLLKFGFESSRCKFWWNLGKFLLKNRNTYFGFIGSEIIAKIEYVHQLQNLYFALTGEELEISLP